MICLIVLYNTLVSLCIYYFFKVKHVKMINILCDGYDETALVVTWFDKVCLPITVIVAISQHI